MSELAGPELAGPSKPKGLKPNNKWIRRIYLLLKVVTALGVLCKAIGEGVASVAKWWF